MLTKVVGKVAGFIIETSLSTIVIGGAVLIVEKLVQNTIKTAEVLKHG